MSTVMQPFELIERQQHRNSIMNDVMVLIKFYRFHESDGRRSSFNESIH